MGVTPMPEQRPPNLSPQEWHRITESLTALSQQIEKVKAAKQAESTKKQTK